MAAIYDEIFRLIMLGTLVTLGPLALCSLSGAFLQALFQIQEAISLQLLRLLVILLTFLVVGAELFENLKDFFELIQNQIVR